MKAGIYYDLPHDEYLAKPALSASGIKRLCDGTPQHFLTSLGPTKSMSLGTMMHELLTEPRAFDAHHVLQPPDIKRRAGKQWDSFRDAVGERTVIGPKDLEKLTIMTSHIREHEEFRNAIQGGDSEVSFFWRDAESGAPMKTRIDKIKRVKRDDGDHIVITEIKTANEATYTHMCKALVQYGYDVQAYMQTTAVRKLLKTPIERIHFRWAVIETEPPHLPVVYPMSPEVLERGYRLTRYAATLYKQCLETGEWPGYPTSPPPLTIPPWAMNKLAI